MNAQGHTARSGRGGSLELDIEAPADATATDTGQRALPRHAGRLNVRTRPHQATATEDRGRVVFVDRRIEAKGCTPFGEDLLGNGLATDVADVWGRVGRRALRGARAIAVRHRRRQDVRSGAVG